MQIARREKLIWFAWGVFFCAFVQGILFFMLTVLFGAGAYLGGQALPDDLYATYPEQRTLEEILNKEVSVIIYVNDRNHIFLDNLFVSGLDVLKFKPILIDAAKLEYFPLMVEA